MVDLPSTRPDQEWTRFVKLEILDYGSPFLGDPLGGSDNYVDARINRQPYKSSVINEEDFFDFPDVYAPWTWIRSVSVAQRQSTPVQRMTVRIETGDADFAGTDDDVYLSIGGVRFPLDKNGHDGFERDSDDTYSVPIGIATREGSRSVTSTECDREGSRRRGGGWFLRRVTLEVNDVVVVNDHSINRWLEDSDRVWNAETVLRDHTTHDVIPV
jgi:hypothetical protein